MGPSRGYIIIDPRDKVATTLADLAAGEKVVVAGREIVLRQSIAYGHKFAREDGRVGVRNYTVVVSTVFCGSTAARRIAEATNAHLITHEGGCGQLGPDKEHTQRVLRDVVTHPNAGAVLVVGLGCEQIKPELVGLAKGKPADSVLIQETGGNGLNLQK